MALMVFVPIKLVPHCAPDLFQRNYPQKMRALLGFSDVELFAFGLFLKIFLFTAADIHNSNQARPNIAPHATAVQSKHRLCGASLYRLAQAKNLVHGKTADRDRVKDLHRTAGITLGDCCQSDECHSVSLYVSL
jgi:hypothetical protein